MFFEKSFQFRNVGDLPAMRDGARELGATYSKLIDGLNKKKILLDRKILADLAEHHPTIFAKVLEAVK